MTFFFGPHRIQYSGVCFVLSLNDTRCSVSIIRPVKAPCHCRISPKGKWYNERNQTVSLSKDRIKAALQRGITGAANSGILPFLSLLANRGLNPRRLETLLRLKQFLVRGDFSGSPSLTLPRLATDQQSATCLHGWDSPVSLRVRIITSGVCFFLSITGSQDGFSCLFMCVCDAVFVFKLD